MRLALPYGRAPLVVEVPEGVEIEVLEPRRLAAPTRSVQEILVDALDHPIGAPALESLGLTSGARVMLVVSDATRAEPRAALIEVLREHLLRAASRVHLTIAIATGTHGPSGLDGLGIPPELLAGCDVLDHDGHDARAATFVELGTTPRGTPVRVHRQLVESDLVIATGCIRPHYFAGFGAGSKAIFPGLGEARSIRINHQWKSAPGARAGLVDGNPCREDLRDAIRLLPTPTYLLDGVCDPDDRVQRAVAGDLDLAFRAGCELARPWFSPSAESRPVELASLVIASEALPVSASLYQAAKVAAAAAPFVAPGGTLVLVAECADGIGPLETVNEAIFRTGVLPRLAPGVRLELVSALGRDATNRTLLSYRARVSEVITEHMTARAGRVLFLPHASKIIAPAPSPDPLHDRT